MAVSDSPWQCVIRIRWWSAGEGGRVSGPPPGPSYSATAVFILGSDVDVLPGWPGTGEHFSVVMEFLPAEDLAGLARARFLAADLAGAYLAEGAEFLVMEGPRAVAEAVVIAIDHD